jgi:phosphohistidine phosphatase
VEIYIVRHGDAIDREDPSVTSDEMRALTERGRAEVGAMATLLGRLGVKPALVLSSPLVRARQTAEILTDALGPRGGPTLSDELIYGGSLAGVLSDILSHGRPEQVILAGHMPSVGHLIGWLTWNDPDSSVPMRTGAVCRVDLPDESPFPGNGDLRWLIPPRVGERLLKS